MAIDTKAKRMSVLNAYWPVYVLGFEPDGSVDADDRLALLHLYSGLAAAAVLDGSLDGSFQTSALLEGSFTTSALIEGSFKTKELVEGSFEVKPDY